MFWKKRKKAEKSDQEVAVPESPIHREELISKAAALEKELENSESKKGIHGLDELESEKRINALNELGGMYFQAGCIEKAIYYYETSLEENNSLGRAYTDLLKLYNIKRREAADMKDDKGAGEYLEKIESLMQLSKDVIRGKR